MKKQAVLSLSGGMDSSTLLLHLLANNYEVTALSFDYGQKHKVELERAKSLIEYLNSNCTTPFVRHQVITLGGLSGLLNSALVEGGADVPEGHYEQENMKETVVPNRNKIFSSIIQAVALSTADKFETECVIAMGIHAGDFAVYPDCRQEFRDADYEAFLAGNWGANLVTMYTPYIDVTKLEILEDGAKCCEQLGLSFDEVYRRTNTSYKPIFIKDEDLTRKAGLQESTPGLGIWYSDYRSAASVERIEAFLKLGRPDPVAYADETGPVSWEKASAHVREVLTAHGK